MGNISNSCFVCKGPVTLENSELNRIVNLRVCLDCKGTETEKITEEEFLDSLADDLICGCI